MLAGNATLSLWTDANPNSNLTKWSISDWARRGAVSPPAVERRQRKDEAKEGQALEYDDLLDRVLDGLRAAMPTSRRVN